MNRDYIISERFIWDDLLARAKFASKEVKKKWKKKRSIPTMVLAWPAETIKDDKGEPLSGIISLEVPKEVPLMTALMDMTVRTKPYALLVCSVTNEELRVVIESHHGVRSWTTPIKRHGDVRVLGETRMEDGVGGYGILWRTTIGSG